jgi:hypothetical protein
LTRKNRPRRSSNTTLTTYDAPISTHVPRPVVDMERTFWMSSFGMPAVQEARLVGRKEWDAYQDAAGERGYAATRPGRSLALGDHLERQGHTLEAEILYRSLSAHSPAAAFRLALGLEAKGRRWDAWGLHFTLAERGVVGSLMRLSVITGQRGLTEPSRRLFDTAADQLPRKAVQRMADGMKYVAAGRDAMSAGRLVMRFAEQLSVDNAFNWGSALHVVAERPDLARLAYLSAMRRGNSLAAVSLLDMTPRSSALSASRELLSARVEEMAPLPDPERHHEMRSRLADEAARLRNDFHDVTVATLLDALRDPTDPQRLTWAIERFMVTTRMFALLQGLRQQNYSSPLDLARLDALADRACDVVATRLPLGEWQSPAEVIACLWRQTAAATCGIAETSETSRDTVRRLPRVTGAGIVQRLGVAFTGLPDDQSRIVVMRLSGLFHSEAAESMGLPCDETRTLHRAANRMLRSAQIGEQLPPLLWQAVEDALAAANPTVPVIVENDPVDEDWAGVKAG